MTLENYLENNYGYNPDIKTGIAQNVDNWKSWYKGKVKSFHNYNIYNGKRNIKVDRLSLQMAKKCCEDWADLLFNDKCSIEMENEQSKDQLYEILIDNGFWTLINQSIEMVGAAGTGALVVSVTDLIHNQDKNVIDVTEAKTKVEYVDFDWVFPISCTGWDITECAFGAKRTIGGKDYIYLSIHKKNQQGNYVIENRVFLDQNGALKEVEVENEAFAYFDTKSPLPWFSILRPAGGNNAATGSPWGTAFFANAIDILKAIDIGFDSFVNEIVLGRKRIFVRMNMMDYDENGERLIFDENDITIYALPKGMNSEDLLQSENSDIRSDALVTYMRTKLSEFSAQVGMGKDRYDFDPTNISTATQVVSQNGDMFRRKKKHETVLERALVIIIEAIAYASSAFGRYNINTDGLTIKFDSSIVEDTDAISNRALRELSAGVISPVEYRTKVFKEPPDVAEAKIKEIRENYPTVRQLVGDE